MKAKVLRSCIKTVSAIILLILLLAMPHSDVLATVSGRVGTAVTKAVFFGDSYGTHPFGEAHWDTYVMQELGLGSRDVRRSIVGGSGFMAGRSNNFLKRLKKMKADRSVRLVLIVGGVRNDLAYSSKKVCSRMKQFDKLVRKKFPKAVICYALPNTDVHSKRMVKKLVARKKILKKTAKRLKWKYLTRSETAMAGHAEYFGSDGHHPSTEGQKVLAAALVTDLKKQKITASSFVSLGDFSSLLRAKGSPELNLSSILKLSDLLLSGAASPKSA